MGEQRLEHSESAANVELTVLEKALELLLDFLSARKWTYNIGYRQLQPHPGIILAKNVPAKLSLQELSDKLSNMCTYSSLKQADHSDASAVQLQFDNHLDARQLLSKREAGVRVNSDNTDKKIFFEPLDTKPAREGPRDRPFAQSFEACLDSIAVENADEFSPAAFTTKDLETVLEKFALFGELETASPSKNTRTNSSRSRKRSSLAT